MKTKLHLQFLSLFLLVILQARVNAQGLLISELLTNPSGNDSPFEYVELVATQNIDFSATPYTIVFANNGTATTAGWVAGGSITYGFSISSGTVNAGDVVYVGGSSMAPAGIKLRTINTATTAGDRFGSAATGGVLGNGGTNADAVAVFNLPIASLTNTSVPVDAIFFGSTVGTAVVNSGTDGYQLPVNDHYSGGKLQSSGFIAPDPAADEIITASGIFNVSTGSFTAARTWTKTTTATSGTSSITLVTNSGLTLNVSTLNFTTSTGSPSASQNYTLKGSSLTSDVTVSAPASFELALSTEGPYSASLSIPYASANEGVTIYVRYNPSTAGTNTGTITHVSGTLSQNISVSGTSVAFIPVYTIQGSGSVSSYDNTIVETQGIVTGDFQGSTELKGFYIQAFPGDSDPSTSDGIFVYDNLFGVSVSVGDLVRVRGEVDEFNGSTEIKNINAVTVLSSGNAIASTNVSLPVTSETDLEKYEGMYVQFQQPLTVTENYNLGRYGELILSGNGRQIQPTNFIDPNDDPASGNNSTGSSNVASVNNQVLFDSLNRITLDDASNVQNPPVVPFLDPSNNTLRTGTTVNGLTGILDFGFSVYRIYPTAAPAFNYAPRPAVPSVGSNGIKIASFNVLNFFNGDGLGGGFPTARGANTPAELARQRTKIIEAMKQLDSDIFGLMEMENDGDDSTSAIADLTRGLNDATSPGTFAYVRYPNGGGNGRAGTDAIKTALIYKPGKVTLSGSAHTDTSDAFNVAGFSRFPLAQTFVVNSNGEKLSVIVNHFKSKGCDNSTGLDVDQNDGQSCWNDRRKHQATELLSFISYIQQISSDPDVLSIGDFNAYEQEDPMDILRAGGLTNLISDNYSFVFNGFSGSLDHAWITPSLASSVSGAEKWHINCDEPRLKDYNQEFNPAYVYAPDAYRSSDHDPVLTGLKFNAAPVVSGFAKTLYDGDVLQISVNDFIQNYQDKDNDALAKIKITALPVHGTLKLNGNTIHAGDEISLINSLSMNYTAAAGYSGLDSVFWSGSDGQAYSITAARIQITVLPAIPTTVTQTPLADSKGNGPFTITANITGNPSLNAQLIYTVNEAAQAPVAPSISGTQYTFVIPAAIGSGIIRYRIAAYGADTVYVPSAIGYLSFSYGPVTVKKYTLGAMPLVGNYEGMPVYLGGASGLYFIPGTANEFYTITDRGPNLDANNNIHVQGDPHAADAKLFPVPSFTPQIMRLKAEGDSLRLISTLLLKRPDGTPVTGMINPLGFGGTGEIALTDTAGDRGTPDVWGIDSEGLIQGNNNDFWICEEYGTSIWNVDAATGKVKNRYAPYGNLPGAQPEDIAIDTVFKYRNPNKGFEGVSFTPNGKVYGFIQNTLLFPASDVNLKKNTRLHRFIEIDPSTNTTRMFGYEHEAVPASGPGSSIKNDKRYIGDAAAVNNNEFLILEHGKSSTESYARIYKITLYGATPITQALYASAGNKSFEQFLTAATAQSNGVNCVSKTLLIDLMANGYNPAIEKEEGLAIVNDSTIAVINDNDFGVISNDADGNVQANGVKTEMYVFTLPPSLKLNLCAPVTIAASGSTALCQGDSVRLSVNTLPGSSFQWKLNGADLAGATTASLFVKTGGTYSVQVSAGSCLANSNRVNVQVAPLPISTVFVSGAITFCKGDSVKLSVLSQQGVQYQWLRNDTALVNAANAFFEAKVSGKYKARLTSASGCTSVSDTYTVNVLPQTAITSAVYAESVCEGNPAAFTISASGNGLTYQWQEKPGTTGSYVNLQDNGTYAGTHSTTLTINANKELNTFKYRCRIKGTCGAIASSGAYTLKVLENPAITVQPVNAAVHTGETATFTVAASGAGLKYRWQIAPPAGIFTNLGNSTTYKNVTTAKLSVSSVKSNLNGYRFRCVVTGDCNTAGIISNAVTLSVIQGTAREGAEMPSDSLGALEVYAIPNPASAETHLVFSERLKEEKEYVIFDMLGNKVASGVVPGETAAIELNTATLANGMYFIHVLGRDKKMFTKLTVLH